MWACLTTVCALSMLCLCSKTTQTSLNERSCGTKAIFETLRTKSLGWVGPSSPAPEWKVVLSRIQSSASQVGEKRSQALGWYAAPQSKKKTILGARLEHVISCMQVCRQHPAARKLYTPQSGARAFVASADCPRQIVAQGLRKEALGRKEQRAARRYGDCDSESQVLCDGQQRISNISVDL